MRGQQVNESGDTSAFVSGRHDMRLAAHKDTNIALKKENDDRILDCCR
jgi:hypothetical protein